MIYDARPGAAPLIGCTLLLQMNQSSTEKTQFTLEHSALLVHETPSSPACDIKRNAHVGRSAPEGTGIRLKTVPVPSVFEALR